jgi:hypothetical protein
MQMLGCTIIFESELKLYLHSTFPFCHIVGNVYYSPLQQVNGLLKVRNANVLGQRRVLTLES